MLMSQGQRAARLRYSDNGFQMLSPGDHVVCAVSGERIPLERLRYWSVAKQEPYCSAAHSTKAALAT